VGVGVDVCEKMVVVGVMVVGKGKGMVVFGLGVCWRKERRRVVDIVGVCFVVCFIFGAAESLRRGGMLVWFCLCVV